jgi:RNA polymerase sigma factor (sigma-70 family)
MNEQEATRLVNELYDSHYSPLLRYALRVIGSMDVARDVLQESFFQLYRSLRLGQSIDSPKAWLFCVVRRELIHQIRHRTRSSANLIHLEDLDQLAAPAGNAPVAGADDLYRLLSVLSRREEEVLLLRLGALKYREIADRLGITCQSVSTHLARAIRKLQLACGKEPKEQPDASLVEKKIPQTLQ